MRMWGRIQRRPSRAVLAAALAVALVAAACSSDDSATPSADTETTVANVSELSVVSQNLLHGIACAEDSDRCALGARVALFAAQLDEAGCPDAVSVQEANQTTVDLLAVELPAVCDGAYEIAWDDDQGIDREVVLTTEEIVGTARYRLAGPLRSTFWVRLATDVGVVDLWSTHLASGSDDGPCDAQSCPPPCEPEDSLQTCQARQLEQLARDEAEGDSLVLVVGDLNAEPGQPTVTVFTDAGYVDSHLAAGNSECDPATGVSCTGGRADTDLSDMTDPQSTQEHRIDYILYNESRGCEALPESGVFQEAGGPGNDAGLVHPADHSGVIAVLACPTSQSQLDAAAAATFPTTTATTEPPSGSLETGDQAAIESAFDLVFSGANPDPEARLQALEDADEMRQVFIDQLEASADIAAQISVQVDSVTLVAPGRADVTFSLLLDGESALGDLSGQAVMVGDTWLVSRQTFCDIATTGLDEIPPACAG